MLPLKELPEPVPRRDDVRVKVLATAVTSSDCLIRSLDLPVAMRMAARKRPPFLTRLREAPCGVTGLAEAIGMEQSAVSHQLRLLRNLGLVTGTRSGKSIIYSLYDDHVAMLLDQAVYHIEHLRLGISDAPAQAAAAVAAV